MSRVPPFYLGVQERHRITASLAASWHARAPVSSLLASVDHSRLVGESISNS